MLTLEQIRSTQINPIAAHEALNQVDRRLADTLDTKKAFEQKASTLFNAYVAISLALFGVGGSLYQAHGGFSSQAMSFLVVGFVFMTGALLFIFALLDEEYGARGSTPDMWLVPGIIDGDDSSLAKMLTYVTYYHQERINKGVQNNATKARLIRQGVRLGAMAPILLLLLLVLL